MSDHEAIELGARMQKARKGSGKELCDIAKEICVSKCYLIAIEEGRFDALPAFPFAVGFVRSFASEIGVDAGEAAQAFKAIVQPVVQEDNSPEHEANRHEATVSKPSVKRGPIYGSLAVVLSVVSAAWMGMSGGGQQAAYVNSAPIGETVQLAKVQEQQTEQAIVTEDETFANSIAAEPVEAIEEGFAPANNELLGVANAKEADENEITLQASEVMFEARQDAWLRITNGDAVLFEGVLQAGDHYVPPMGPALSLTTSNAGGLALHIGEHDLGVLGARGDIIENARIDPDSLILRLVETL